MDWMLRCFMGMGVLLLCWGRVVGQCPTCGNGVVDVGETNVNCPQDVAHGATCTSPCGQPGSFEAAAGMRQSWDFVGTTTWSTVGLPVGWSFAGGPSGSTAGPLPAADVYGAKAGLIQPNCSGSCTSTNGFCIGNLANTQAVGSGGSSGKLGANFDGRANVSSNLSYAVLRGQGNPTLVSPTLDMSGVEGFKVQFWLFPSETSCGQTNSWGSCTGNAAFLDFSSNSGSTWTQIMQMDLSSSGTDMCFNNSTNTKWLTESAWSRVCLTVFRSTTAPGNFYTAASGTTAASGIMVNSAFFTSGFKFRIRYAQSASCTSGITTTNPGRYLAIDYPVVTSGDEMIPCGISFANLCGYGADGNDDGVGSSVGTTTTVAFGTTRRGVNQAERGVELFSSQNGTFGSQNLSGSSLPSNHDLCNAEGGDKQCINWSANNNSYFVAYECITDWEVATGNVLVQYYKGTTPLSFGLTKVTAVGKTALLGWRYSGSRFVNCGSTSDLNAGCNGYSFTTNSLPTQFARVFYHLAINSTGQSWSTYGATSCSHYFGAPSVSAIATPDTLTGYGNYTICQSGTLYFTGLVDHCLDASGLTGSGTLQVSGPSGYSDVFNSGDIGTVAITTAGTYVITAQGPSSPAQCTQCGYKACITVSPTEIANCGVVPVPGLRFWALVDPEGHVRLLWQVEGDEFARSYVVERQYAGGEWGVVDAQPHVRGLRDYHADDAAAWGGLRRYRLRFEQPDGAQVLSDVVEVDLGEGQGLQVGPNPVRGPGRLVQVQVPDGEAAVVASLYDLAGRAVGEWTFEGPRGVLSLGGLAPGCYLLQCKVAGRLHTQRLLVE